MEFAKIEITFKSGETITYGKDQWDDKELRETDWKESHNIGMLQPIDNPEKVMLYDDMANIIILVHDADNFQNEKVIKLNELK